MTDSAPRLPRESDGGGRERHSAARLTAVQALYQIDHSGVNAEIVLEEFLRYRLGDSFDTAHDIAPHEKLFTDIIRGVAGHTASIDEIISSALSSKWTFIRLEIILRAILRAGVYELRARTRTSARVIINEYVDVAHAFYDGQEPGMVNGVLDRVARLLRTGEFVGTKVEE